jgi:alcohol dehydrogenase class IV
LHPQVGQGEANTALTPTVVRRLGPRDPLAMAKMAQGLGVWQPDEAVALAPERAAVELERVLQAAGLPTRISQLGIPRESLPAVVAHSLKNFNADPKREFLKEQAMLAGLIQDCW